MFLRIFLKIIKPTNSLLSNKSRTKFGSFQVRLYHYFLNNLLKSYSHYAISDTIYIGDNVRIVHEFRDREFEKELARNKIDFNLKTRLTSIPSVSTKSNHKSHFSYFRFKDLLVIYLGEKELFIRHDDEYLIDGNQKCKVKCTSGLNGLAQSVIEIKNSNSKKEEDQTTGHVLSKEQKKEPDVPKVDKPRITKAKGLFSRDKVLTPIPTEGVTNSRSEIDLDNSPKVIEKKGFEIDSSF